MSLWPRPHSDSEPDLASDPLEVLRYLVEENGVTTRKLGKILGVDHSVAARILTGERSITVEHAEKLGARFKVEPQLFLGLRAESAAGSPLLFF